jgi:hypothetical protein
MYLQSGDLKLLKEGIQKKNKLIADSWREIAERFGYKDESGARKRFELLYQYFEELISFSENMETNKINKIESLNSMNVDVESKRIITLNDALIIAKVDLNIWEVEKWEFNKWEVGRKDKKVDMVINNGISTGTVKDTGKIYVEPLYKINIKLIRKQPIKQKFPCISPVKVNIDNKIEYEKPRRQLKRAFLIADSHFGFNKNLFTNELDPYHDRKCLDIACQLIEKTQPETVILLGDMIDLSEWSDKFIKKPEFYFTTQPALNELAWWLGRIRSLVPDSEIVYLEGNHEYRILKYIYNNVLNAYGLQKANQEHNKSILSIPYLLGLDDLNIKYFSGYPDNEFWLNKNLKLIHGNVVSSGSGATVKKIIQDTRSSVGTGHTHRIEKTGKTVFYNNEIINYTVFTPGCTCRIDGVVPAKNSKVNWQQGLGHLYYNEDDFQVNIIQITNGSAIFEGDFYIGEERKELIEKEIKL